MKLAEVVEINGAHCVIINPILIVSTFAVLAGGYALLLWLLHQ